MPPNRPAQPPDPSTKPGGILCPYCGNVSANPRRCDVCAGFFDPLSRQASQNAMGPWFIRDGAHPFRPGCSYETLKELIRRRRVVRGTVLRGPSTRQFWSFASRTPSVANLLGVCHNCQAEVDPGAFACPSCGAAFSPETDRQHLGLAPVHLLPGQAPPEIIAATAASERTPQRPPRRQQPQTETPAQDGDAAPDPARQNATRRPTFWIALAITGGLVLAIGAAVVNWALRQPVPPRVTVREPSAPPPPEGAPAETAPALAAPEQPPPEEADSPPPGPSGEPEETPPDAPQPSAPPA